MRYAAQPRPKIKASGQEVFYADYQDETGRHQKLCDTIEEAKLLKEEFDLRPNPNISLAGFILHFRRYKLAFKSATRMANAPSHLLACAKVAPDIALAAVTETTINELRHALERPPKGIDARKTSTIVNDIYILKLVFDRAVMEGRIRSNPVADFLANPDYRIERDKVEPDVPPEIDYDAITSILSPHGGRAFEMVGKAGLTFPEAVCVRPEFIDPAAGTLVVGLHWKRDNTIGTPKNLPPRTVRGLPSDWLEWLLAAPRYVGDDGFLLQAYTSRGRLWGRRHMRQEVVAEVAAAQRSVGLRSMKTGLPFPGKDLRTAYTVELFERLPEQLLTIQAMSGHSNADYFTKKFANWLDAEEIHTEMEGTLETVDKLGKLDPLAFKPRDTNLNAVLAAWDRLG